MKRKIIAFLLILSLALCCLSSAAAEEGTEYREEDWFTFFLMCNEGMRNDGDNVGNTMMIVSVNPTNGRIKLLMFTWDSFIEYPGYDLPQLIDQPFRVAGPEETMKVFNSNFNLDVDSFLSINYLNLASLIDSYGGVNVDITRAERNALNGMVGDKADALLAQYAGDAVMRTAIEALTSEYYLSEYGFDTHLNGLQAVGFGWLQYDSIYNCCKREVDVISRLFSSVAATASEQTIFYDSTLGTPDVNDGRRKIDLSNMTEEDDAYIYRFVEPIFDNSYHNISDEDIMRVSTAIIATAYAAARNGINMFDRVEVLILPLEVLEPYDTVAGKQGHLVDYAENEIAIKDFLYGDD